MAVQFLNNIDLNNNQLQEFKVDNRTSDPTGLAGEGQLIYRTDSNALKYHTGSDNWVTLGTSSSTGTVTSVAATHAGNAFTASIGNVSTVNPSVDITMAGNANEYINGAGNRVLLSTIPQGDITGISPTDGLTGTDLNGPIPVIKVEYVGTDNIVLKASDLNGAGTPVGADSIMFSDATDNDVRTATISQIVALAPQGDITAVVAGTGMTGGGTSGSVTLNVIGSSGILANADNIAIDYTATGIINDANSGTSITLLDADEFLFEDASATASVAVKRGTLSQLKTYIGAVTGVTSVNFKTDGTALDVASNTVTGSGTMTGIWQGSSAQYVRGDGDLATFPTIGDGDIIGATSGLGITGSMSATANQTGDTTFTVTSNATTASTPSTLMYRDSSGFGYVDTPSSGDSSEKIATTAFVQSAVTGLLEFKSGFNASTGIIADGSGDDLYTDRAISVGDYYVVTVAGNFFGNTATPLTPGDSVIVQADAAAGAAVEADFIVVQSDTDLATNSTVGLMYINPTGTGITSNISSGAATLTNTDRGSSQNIFKNVASDSGTAVADNNNDTLSIVGAGGASTAVSGDILTITSANDNTEYTAGTGLTLSGTVFNANVDGTQTVAANTSSTTASRTYKVQVDSGDNLVVNVPWSDSNTGLTSVGVTETGNALTITNSPLTANGNINIAGAGTASQVILGNLTLGTYTTGTVTSVATTGPITGGTFTGSGTIGISNATAGAVGAARVSAGTGISVAVSSGNFTVTNTETNSDNTYAETITDTDLLIDHNLGTTDVIVQLYDVTEGVTVYADVDRISANRIGVTFGSTPTNSVRVLVQKIG
jgi:hypothetical protein